MQAHFIEVTEISGEMVSSEQVARLCDRYYWAGSYVKNKDVLEVACGTGPGLGYLKEHAKTLKAGDVSDAILAIARKHYEERVELLSFDACHMPFERDSFDVVVIAEAIYYVLDVDRFLAECRRVLRVGGKLLIITANKDLYDFNPSPYSRQYYGVLELKQSLKRHRFQGAFFGGTPVGKLPLKQRILRPIKKVATTLNLIPKTMAGKSWLKRLVFGTLVSMPQEITKDTSIYTPPTPILDDQADRVHKVIFCEATLMQKD